MGGNIEATKDAIAAGSDVNAKDDFGSTPLHLVARYGSKQSAYASKENI